MPEPKGNDVQRTLAVRVSPDYHAQLSMVAQVDGISLTDLMMKALDSYMVSRREAPEFKGQGADCARKKLKPRWHEPRPCCSGHCPKRHPPAKLGLMRRPQVVVGARVSLPAEADGNPQSERRAA